MDLLTIYPLFTDRAVPSVLKQFSDHHRDGDSPDGGDSTFSDIRHFLTKPSPKVGKNPYKAAGCFGFQVYTYSNPPKW